ncbi:MAG: hypothetical protein KDD42_09205 [Bdellovibrionales bacterium]|nr:hypothetical protein [Bdellovibrionales bacterium]
MPNLHPALVSLPVALFPLVLMLELWKSLWYRKELQFAIYVNVSAAIIGVLLAFFSGYQASELANQSFIVPDQAIERHHRVSQILLFLSLPCGVLCVLSEVAQYARRAFRYLYLLILVSCSALVVYTGYLGGQLVFQHGAGVALELGDLIPPAN